MTHLRLLLVTFVLFWGLLSSVSARAQDQAVPQSRIEAVRGVALGTGVRASAMGSQAQADNPANLVRGGLYHLEAFAQYDPNYGNTSLGAAVVDSMTTKLAAGFSMRGLVGKNEAGRNSGYDGRLGLAYPLMDALSVGVAFRYADIRVPNPDAPDRDPSPDEDDRRYRLKHFTMDAALSLHLEALTVSGFAYNLVDTDSPLAPLQAGGGLAFAALDALTLGGDVIVDVRTFDRPKVLAGAGVEYLLSGSFPLRVGYQYDQGQQRHAVTGGLGYVDEIVGLNASVRHQFGDVDETNLVFAFQYFVR